MAIKKIRFGIEVSDHPFNYVVREVELQLTKAEILALNGTPIEAIAAPGAGKWIEIERASVFLDYLTAAYATQTDLQLLYGTGSAYMDAAAILAATADEYQVFAIASGGSDEIAINKAINVFVPTADPTAGSGTATLYIRYIIRG